MTARRSEKYVYFRTQHGDCKRSRSKITVKNALDQGGCMITHNEYYSQAKRSTGRPKVLSAPPPDDAYVDRLEAAILAYADGAAHAVEFYKAQGHVAQILRLADRIRSRRRDSIRSEIAEGVSHD